MESALILEGCQQLDNENDIRIKELIADGCTNVLRTLIKGLEYGENIIKIECTNHIMKNYKKFLYKHEGYIIFKKKFTKKLI